MLKNLNNYGMYIPLIETSRITIKSEDINWKTWDEHFNSIYNIMRDGIETEQVQSMIITVDFGDMQVELYIFDYWFNLIMWKLKCPLGEPIRPKDLLFDDFIRAKHIKQYIDKFLEENIEKYSNVILNNIIDDCLFEFSKIDTFAWYLSNTIDVDSFVTLWYECPEAREIMSIKMATPDNTVPIEQTMSVGTEASNKLLAMIRESDMCLSDIVKAGQGMSNKQFKEFATHIGPKPNGKGGTFPYILDTNFLMGGVNSTAAYAIESAIGRIAQLIVKGNVGDAGYFANILKLNNIDTNIYPDKNYDCGTNNLIHITLENEDMARRFVKSWFRYSPNGVEMVLTDRMVPFIVGKTIYIRTPMTCASHAKGRGICYKCYGNLAYTNEEKNAGEIASEILSAQLTQKMLSAKHLLESAIIKLEWSHGFKDYFQVDYNTISIRDEIDVKKMKIKINIDSIDAQSEDDYAEDRMFNEFVTSFVLVLPTGQELPVFTSSNDSLFITQPLNELLRKTKEDEEGNIIVDLSKLEGLPLFMIEIRNNELTQGLNLIKGLINNKSNIEKMENKTISNWLQQLLETCIKCDMEIHAVHLAVILSNQIRHIDYELEKPEWEYPNEPYEMVTLNQALTKNPSITISMLYKKLGNVLFNPISFRKHKASQLDPFFMVKPHEVIQNKVKITDTKIDDESLVEAISFGDE